MFRANPTQHISEYHSSYFQALWWLVMGMLVIGEDQGVFVDKKKQNRAKHRQNHRGKSGSNCEKMSPFSRTITSNTRPNIHQIA